MHQLVIQHAQSNQIGAVEEIARLAYEKYVSRIGRPPAPMVADFARHLADDALFVGLWENECVGYCVCYPHQDHFHISNVALHPKMQGRGFGKQLIEWAENRAVESGWSEVRLYTNTAMTENLTLYTHLGYQEFDRRLQDGFNRVFMKKQLSKPSSG